MKKSFYILLALFLSSLVLNAQKQGQAQIDSLLKMLSKVKVDTAKVEILSTLSHSYYTINPFEGLEYGKIGLHLAMKINWKKGIADCYNSISANEFALGNLDSSLVFSKRALLINKRFNNKENIAKNLNNIGIIYQYYPDYEEALDYFYRALSIYKEMNSDIGLAINYGNIGNIYYYQSEYLKALEYYDKASNICGALGDESGIATNIGNMGNVYLGLLEYGKALECYKIAEEIFTEIGDKNGKSRFMLNIGSLHLELSKDLTLSMIDESKIKVDLSKDVNLKKAINYLTQAKDIAESIGDKLMIIECYNDLQAAYKENNNYEQAYIYLSLEKALQDSISSTKANEKLDKVMAMFAREQKRTEEFKKIEEMNYRNSIQYGSIFLILIVLLIAISIIRKFNIKPGFIEASVFFTFLLFYEFVTVLIEPWADGITNQEPLFKLGINIAVALIFVPLSKVEHRVRLRFVGAG